MTRFFTASPRDLRGREGRRRRTVPPVLVGRAEGTPPQLAAGVSSLGSYVSTEFGTVNLSNGGLNINIPLGTIGGRGNVALPLSLSYSSKLWLGTKDVDTEK